MLRIAHTVRNMIVPIFLVCEEKDVYLQCFCDFGQGGNIFINKQKNRLLNNTLIIYYSTLMRKITMLMVIAATMMTAISCGPKKEAQKVLVLYYSQTSNTKAVAEEIATRLGADIEEIVPVIPYDGDFKATIERCVQDREQGGLPEIQPIAADLAQYDIVFVGYPVPRCPRTPPRYGTDFLLADGRLQRQRQADSLPESGI